MITPRSSILNQISDQIKLVLRLMADSRVSPFLKLLPVGSLAYLLIPDLMIGPIDDAVVVWLGFFMFIEFCPPEIVKEHRSALNQDVNSSWHDPLKDKEDNIIDAEFHRED